MPDVRRLVRLENEQISTAIFEIRFEPRMPGVADLLPGILFATFAQDFPQIAPTPISQVPLPVRQQMPDWQYAPLKQMVGVGVNINVGEKSIAVEVFRPYMGWVRFKEYIYRLIVAIDKSGLVDSIQRYSLRYSNILSPDFLTGLDGLNLNVGVANFLVMPDGFQMRFEVEHEDKRAIIQIATNAETTVVSSGQSHKLKGILVDVDVLKIGDAIDFFRAYKERIESLHDAEKQIFFSILRDVSIERLGPIWAGEGGK